MLMNMSSELTMCKHDYSTILERQTNIITHLPEECGLHAVECSYSEPFGVFPLVESRKIPSMMT